MAHAGASWPIVPEDAVLAILGDPVVYRWTGPTEHETVDQLERR